MGRAVAYPVLLLGLLFVPTVLLADQVLIGIVEMVDPTLQRITIKTDSGQSEGFSVTNAYALKRLAVNDRVKVEVGSDGMVSQVTKMAPDEDKAGGRQQ